jgi:peptidoglycan/LPS O-acetylase OafA/YrhL
MAIGAIVTLVVLFLRPESRPLLGSLPIIWLVVVMVILVLITSVGFLDIPANLLLGALGFIFAYQYETFKQLYDSGWIVFVLFFLILAAAFMKRPRYAD